MVRHHRQGPQTAPTFTVPEDILICRETDFSYNIDINATGDVTDESDNCTAELEAMYEDDTSGLTSYNQLGFILRTWTLTDNCGNSVSKIQTIWIEPTPRLTFTPTVETICDGATTNIKIESPTQPKFPVRFDYQLVIDNIDSLQLSTSGSGTGLYTGAVILESFDNMSDRPQRAVLTAVPYTVDDSGIKKCTGIEASIEIWINPTPRATPVNVKPAICYAEYTEIELFSPTVMTPGSDVRFNYSITVPSGVTGNSDPGTDKEQGSVLSFQYKNENEALQSVFFSITPIVVGIDCPEGDEVVKEVQVHPYPARGITITKPFTCEAGTGRAALEAEISSGAAPYSLLWTGPVGYMMTDSLEITNLYAGGYTLAVEDNLGCKGQSDIFINNQSASARIIPMPVLPNIHVSCPGGNDGNARIYVRDGITFPYDYWFVYNGTDTVDSGIFSGNYDVGIPTTYRLIPGLPAGEYKLIIRDRNGCESFRTAELKDPEPVEVSFTISDYSGSHISCRGYYDGYADAAVTGGNGSYTYFWYPATGSLTVSTSYPRLDSIPAGKYYLRVTDLLGCVQIDSVTLTDPPGMILLSSETSHSNDNNYEISCHGASDGYIKMTISGGSGNYTYSWEGPGGYSASTRDISGLKTGDYVCTVTDINGCVLTPKPSFTLDEPEEMIISYVSSVSADGSYNISCNGGTGSVDVTVTGGSVGSYNYTWSSSDGSGIVAGQQDQTLLTAASYHLIVTDLNGCIVEKEIQLTQPPALVTEMTVTHTTCQTSGFDDGSVNLTVSGGIEPYSYSWSTGATTQDIAALTPGIYFISITDANGCLKTDSARINLPPPLSYDKILTDYNGYNISCFGKSDGSIQINPTSGTPPYTISWQGPGGFSSSTKDITGLIAGQYILNITDDKMCSAIETIVLTEPGRMGLTVTTSVSLSGDDNINCSGAKTGTISVETENNAGSVVYLWADGEVGKERTGLKAGNYKVITTDSNGCWADSTILLTEPDPITITFTVTQPFCTDMPDGQIATNVTGGTNSGYTFMWSDNSVTQNITNAVSGLYSLTVTDANGCSAAGKVFIHPLNDVCLVLPNAISPNGDLINDVWNIGLRELYPEMEVKIFNRWGELIWKSDRGYPLPWDGRSKGNVLPVDSYHYTIDLHNGTRPLIGHITIVK